MKKHAFLIMAHNNFSILERLMLLLDTPYNDIFIHIDKKAKSIDINRLQSICTKAHVFITKRYNVTWGSSKQVRAELNLFQTACKYGPYWYYHLCSGCDLPIKTATEIYKFFEKIDQTIYSITKNLQNMITKGYRLIVIFLRKTPY